MNVVRQSASLQSPVERPGRPRFGLHFNHLRDHSPDVLAAFLLPLVGPFAHGGCRSDGIDSDDFVQAVGNVCDRFVSVDNG